VALDVAFMNFLHSSKRRTKEKAGKRALALYEKPTPVWIYQGKKSVFEEGFNGFCIHEC